MKRVTEITFIILGILLKSRVENSKAAYRKIIRISNCFHSKIVCINFEAHTRRQKKQESTVYESTDLII
jgi:hypothetical protein